MDLRSTGDANRSEESGRQAEPDFCREPGNCAGSVHQLWEARELPHGVVHHHFYKSKVVKGLVTAE